MNTISTHTAQKNRKVVVITGQTATGKSDLAVRLAKKYNGEVISADSRQVYEGLDIGTGKITKKEMRGVPHHLLDVVGVRKLAREGVEGFTAADFAHLARQAIDDILSRRKLPIICGGTGFYVDALLGDAALPNIPPNKELRKKLETLSTEKLFENLKKLNPKRTQTIDRKNRRRLIRAIEVAARNDDAMPSELHQGLVGYEILKIGLALPPEELRGKIVVRLMKRIKAGMIAEAERIHKKGVSWKKMEALGLEYRYLALHLQGKISREEMIETLKKETWRYAKRQKTWFSRDKKIVWCDPRETQKIEKIAEDFLSL